MATTFTTKANSLQGLHVKEYTNSDFTSTTVGDIITYSAIKVADAQSVTIAVKSSLSSLYSIIDTQATATLGQNVVLYSGSAATSFVQTINLAQLALHQIQIVVNGQTGVPTVTLFVRVNAYN